MEFIVKTTADRNLVIEADKFELTNGPDPTYIFWKTFESETRRVASVQALKVFAVIENESEVADYYDHYEPKWNDPVPTAEPGPDPSRRIERRVIEGAPSWGVVYDNKFFPFGDGPDGKEAAERNREYVGPGWFWNNLEDTEVIQ